MSSSPAVDPARWRELNQAWWDERTPLHVRSDLYDVEGFRAGRPTLEPFELELLGPVEGLRLAHLQCHFGLDSMGWARRGASVVGLDFSAPAVDTANALASELGLDARFVRADVYDAVAALDGEQFDVVYTGLGALNWLPDLDAWAQVVAALVRPGGRLLLSEFHPFSWVFDVEEGEGLRVTDDYFGGAPLVYDEAGSYADLSAATEHNQTVEHQHPLAEIFSALLGQGFRITAYRELDYTLFPQFPFLEAHPDRTWRLPADHPRIPLMFGLVAER